MSNVAKCGTRGKPATANPTRAEYDARHAEIKAKLARIGKLVENYRYATVIMRDANYGSVGDLGHVAAKLDEIVEFLGSN